MTAPLVAFQAGGREIRAPLGSSLLVALRKGGVDVPSLCHHDAVTPYGACRLCLVEVETGSHGRVRRRLTTSCNYPVLEGIRVFTDTDKVLRHRRIVLELLLAECPEAPEVIDLAERYGVAATRFRRLDRDCILCGLCERTCRGVVGVDAIGFSGRGGIRDVEAPFAAEAERCTACGACAYVCPVGCIEVIDADGARKIPRWRVERELVRCVECGKPVGTRMQIDRVRSRVPAEPWVYDRCVDCRRALYSLRVAMDGHM